MGAFTGRRRQRKTAASIKFGDVAAKWTITLGGIGTIGAVLLVAVFLFWVVWPLFMPASVKDSHQASVPWEEVQPVRVDTDEYQQMGYAVFADGQVFMFDLADGKLLASQRLFDPTPKLTAWSFSPGMAEAAFGFEDGTARLARIGFNLEFLNLEQVPAELRQTPVGEAVRMERDGDNGMLQRLGDNQFRFVRFSVKLHDPIQTGSESPVVLLDHSVSPTATRLVALHEDGSLFVEELRERTNVLTGETVYSVRKGQVPFELPEKRGRPDYLKLSGLGDSVLAIWKDGLLQRYDVRSLTNTRFSETVDLTQGQDVWLTKVQFLLGKITLVVADSKGGVHAWFPTRPEGAITPDGAVMTHGGTLRQPDGVAVSSMGVADRSRLVSIGMADGRVQIVHATSHKVVADLAAAPGEAIAFLTLAPKSDGLIALTNSALRQYRMDVGHPEVTPTSLFTPVWYESATTPAHVWQSTGGTDDFEEKFGLYPLIFGTIKATVYSLLFGVPIALLAAIYTSEFMNPRVKATVKPIIEMMASLPSVVLGFLAGLVVAPFVENIVPSVLASFLCIPLMFLVGAHCWQLLPQRLSLRWSQWRFVVILAVVPLGVLLAAVAGPLIERGLFAGDFKLWLNADSQDERFGSGFGGWTLMYLPMCGILVAGLVGRYVNPVLIARSTGWPRAKLAMVDMIKFILAIVAAVALACLVGGTFSAVGWDPRGGIHDTYVQRNALVVGFIMGFAIIPIIYTIAEDALSTVPQHLRSASLATGATPWQTAVRIIVPTAMSGLFSAVMIGLGRAVGETMIVLMAAGNTPVMEMNIFNGFRTLSANIAVELPEAVKNSTHYRTLYLAALVLFIITFVLNTLAESVRQRFRKRAYQL